MTDSISAILPSHAVEVEPRRFTLAMLERSLAEQSDMSAVERFSSRHDASTLDLKENLYRELLPARSPAPGEQYAFEVDLDSCSGCKACVSACHSLNGLDEAETWRSVGFLHGGTPLAPLQKTVTTACHHCVDPACMKGCPVNAYEKDPVTGIVRHLDDQCIGCQYCIWTCPYEVPKFNERLGIVRKCDMCSDRLAVGEAPACVQGCPNGAITITLATQESIREAAVAEAFLPGAPSSMVTLPSTRFVSASPLPASLRHADEDAVSPAHQHVPLISLLVLTQLSAGTFASAFLAERLVPNLQQNFVPIMAALGFVFGILGLLASVSHLGRPLYGFRAILNVGRSWMSREVLAFGLFAGVSGAYFTSEIAQLQAAEAFVPASLAKYAVELRAPLAMATALVGVAAVSTSMMLYHVTRRHYWAAVRTGPRFFGTTATLGLATACLVSAIAYRLDGGGLLPVMLAGRSLVLVSFAKLLAEAAFFFINLRPGSHLELARSARLLVGPLESVTFARFVLGVIGGLVVPFFLLAAPEPDASISLVVGGSFALILSLVGETLERTTFFTALSAPRMPGGIPG